MKVLLVTHYFSNHGGGVELVASRLAQELLNLAPDLNITWYASKVDSFPEAHSRLTLVGIPAWNELEKRTGVPCPIWSPSGIWRLWKEIKQSDCVHLHDYIYSGNVAAAFFCRLLKKPYIVTQHIGFVPFKRPLLRMVLEYSNRILGRYILNGASHVFFISDEVKTYFSNRGVTQRTRLLPNGVDSQMFHPINDEQKQLLRTKLLLPPNKPVVLFVGRFVEKKGVPLLVDIAAGREEYQWIFAGHGPLDPQNDFSVLPAHIQVFRDRTGKQIAELYQAADILILPSVGEGFPLVVQESLACGTPVLVERALGAALPEAVSWMNLQDLGKPDDKQLWEESLTHILKQMPEPQQKRFERAEFAKTAWSWQKCARVYLDTFRNL